MIVIRISNVTEYDCDHVYQTSQNMIMKRRSNVTEYDCETYIKRDRI